MTSNSGLTAVQNFDVCTSQNQSTSKLPKLSALALRALERKLFAGPKTAAVDLGCAPFFILQPLLKRASPTHLMQIELYNEHLVEDTVDLWRVHVEREWPALTDGYDEEKLKRTNWRKLYYKQHAEQEKKIASISAKMRSRYSEISAEKERKKIVFVDKVIPTKAMRSRGGWGNSLPVGQKGSRVVTKVRAELKRSAALFRHPEAPISRRLPGISHRMDAGSELLPSLPATAKSGIRMTTSNTSDTPNEASVAKSGTSVFGGGLPRRQAKPNVDDDGEFDGVSKAETRRLLDAMTWTPPTTKPKIPSPQNIPRTKPKVAESASLFIPKRKTNVEAQAGGGRPRIPDSQNMVAAPASIMNRQGASSKRKPESMGISQTAKRQRE